MNKTEQDSYWHTQVSRLKRAGLLRQQVPPHQGYRQKLHSWKSSAVTLNAGCDDAGEWVHVDITIKGEFRSSWFRRLEKQNDKLTRAVEADLVTEVEKPHLEWIWDPRDKNGESWIILRWHELDLSDKRSCQVGQEWVTQAVKAFSKHFGPLLDTL